MSRMLHGVCTDVISILGLRLSLVTELKKVVPDTMERECVTSTRGWNETSFCVPLGARQWYLAFYVY